MADIPYSERRSGTELMSPETRAMQADDLANPGMLSVGEGEDLWKRPAVAGGRSCAACHGDARISMKGVAARHPAYDGRTSRPIDLDGRINRCRTENQAAPGLARESAELLSLSAYVAHQSRGLPIAVPWDERLSAHRRQGERLFRRRLGQLDLSCAQCHDDNWGKRLAGSSIPQGHPTGYPMYRLEWQGLGSLHRRLGNCLAGVRAEPFPAGAPELIDLELYLMWRARGMAVETPAVRP